MELHMASINLHVIINHRSLTRSPQYDARPSANITGTEPNERIEDGGNRHGVLTAALHRRQARTPLAHAPIMW